MPNATASPSDPARLRFIAEVESHLGRSVNESERQLALSLIDDKSAALVAREIAGAPITDPKKIRPEHKDTADEGPAAGGAVGTDR